MLFRVLLSSLFLLTATAPGPLFAQAVKAPAAKEAKDAQIAPTTSAVYSRTKGATTWNLFGYYSSEASARRVFEHLARTGYEVELRISNRPIPKLPPRPTSGLLPLSETVTFQKAVDVFNWMAKQSDIAFRFPADGCYARAELMVERMQKNGFKPRKIWSVANGDELYARTKNHPRGYVTWAYHVAPMLRVRNTDNTQLWYVIDPSVSTKPLTVAQWELVQMRTPKSQPPYVTLTKPGEAPLWVDKKRKQGSGYWPGADPKPGTHNHAVAVMKKYKAWEGKEPPKGVVKAVAGSRWETERHWALAPRRWTRVG